MAPASPMSTPSQAESRPNSTIENRPQPWWSVPRNAAVYTVLVHRPVTFTISFFISLFFYHASIIFNVTGIKPPDCFLCRSDSSHDSSAQAQRTRPRPRRKRAPATSTSTSSSSSSSFQASLQSSSSSSMSRSSQQLSSSELNSEERASGNSSKSAPLSYPRMGLRSRRRNQSVSFDPSALGDVEESDEEVEEEGGESDDRSSSYSIDSLTDDLPASFSGGEHSDTEPSEVGTESSDTVNSKISTISQSKHHPFAPFSWFKRNPSVRSEKSSQTSTNRANSLPEVSTTPSSINSTGLLKTHKHLCPKHRHASGPKSASGSKRPSLTLTTSDPLPLASRKSGNSPVASPINIIDAKTTLVPSITTPEVTASTEPQLKRPRTPSFLKRPFRSRSPSATRSSPTNTPPRSPSLLPTVPMVVKSASKRVSLDAGESQSPIDSTGKSGLTLTDFGVLA